MSSKSNRDDVRCDDHYDVVKKLKRTLKETQSGTAIGALVITIDTQGVWGATLAGKLERDSDALCAIACRLLGGCLAIS